MSKPSKLTLAFGRNEAERKKPKKLPVPEGGELKPRHPRMTPLDNKTQCAFVIGTPNVDKWGYCGRKVVAGSSYCAVHAARTSQPIRPPVKK